VTFKISWGYFYETSEFENDRISLGAEPWQSYWQAYRSYLEEFIPAYFKKYMQEDVEVWYLHYPPRSHRGNAIAVENLTARWDYEYHKMALDHLHILNSDAWGVGRPFGKIDHFALVTSLPKEKLFHGGVAGQHFGPYSITSVPRMKLLEDRRRGYVSTYPNHALSEVELFVQSTDGGRACIIGHELTHAVLDYHYDQALNIAPYPEVWWPDGLDLSGGVYLDNKLEPVEKPTSNPANWRWMAQRISKDLPCQFPLYPCPPRGKD